MRRGLGFHARHSPGLREFSPSSLFTGGVQGAWYDPSDSTTLFSDRAGTTPCAAPGTGALVPVGLMLDKSQNLTLGSELVTNGDFSNGTTGWTPRPDSNTPSISVVAGELRVTNIGAVYGTVLQSITTVSGKTYKVTANAYAGTANAVFIGAKNASIANPDLAAVSTTSKTSVLLSFVFTAQSATTVLVLVNDNQNNATGFFDNVSVRELAGNHAIAANDTTARPELSARVNLLTYTEEFQNAAWTKTNATVTQDAVANPVTGVVNADAIFETTATGLHAVRATISPGATTHTLSLYAKSIGGRNVNIEFSNGSNGAYFAVNLSDGSTIASGIYGSGFAIVGTPTATLIGNGWYRLVLSASFPSLSTFVWIFGLDGGSSSYAGDAAKGLYLWGADVRQSNIGTTIPAYQRVADQYTYDTVGFPRYLAFNGTSSAMSTPANVNLSGTDKATVFAGVRKNSDASQRVVAELSATIASNNGTFLLTAPNSAAANYNFSSKGTTQVDNTVTTFTAPITNVLTGQADIAAPSNVIRVNGVATTVTSTQGTGNFANLPLFIGARNNGSLFHNGNIYGLAVVGAASAAGQVTSMEQWLAGKTGITI